MSRPRSEISFDHTPDRVTGQIGADDGAGQREVPALTLAWAAHDPGRAGEVVLCADYSPLILGRGGARADDGATRATFLRQRPGVLERRAPLTASVLSRRHVRLTPELDSIAVERLGKGTIAIDGEPTEQGVLWPGSTLLLANELLLLCERRPYQLVPTRPSPFSFGESDVAGFTGETPAAWRLRDQAQFVAGSSSPLLIVGPRGAGKEVVARAVQQHSAWRDRPWLVLSGATLSAADLDTLGRREDGPFVFIDELASVPGETQPRLSRALENALSQRPPRPRLVAATTGDGLDRVRPDLLTRFILKLRVPPLDDRRADIPLLVRAILREIAAEQPEVKSRFFTPPGPNAQGVGEPRVTPRLIDLLLRHRWQAHVRELTALLWLSMTTAVGPFLDATAEVVAELDQDDERFNDPNELDPKAVRQALDAAKGRVVVAAQLLGLKNRWVLYRLLEKLDIRP